MSKKEWVANYETLQAAIKAADGLNHLATQGNTVMNCSFYTYHVGETTHKEMSAGLYREKENKCRHCGDDITTHNRHKINNHYNLPCGRDQKERYNP